MAEAQPANVVEGATTGDYEEEVPKAASAEDRKAAAALSSLDSRADESAGTKDVDQEAVRKAMERLGGGAAATNGTVAKLGDDKKVVKKAIKVDQADLALVMAELELSKIKATDLLKAHEGLVGKALKAYITPPA